MACPKNSHHINDLAAPPRFTPVPCPCPSFLLRRVDTLDKVSASSVENLSVWSVIMQHAGRARNGATTSLHTACWHRCRHIQIGPAESTGGSR